MHYCVNVKQFCKKTLHYLPESCAVSLFWTRAENLQEKTEKDGPKEFVTDSRHTQSKTTLISSQYGRGPLISNFQLPNRWRNCSYDKK